MKKIFVEIIENGFKEYQECTESHEPNETTRQVIKNINARKGLKKAASVDELFKKLRP